MAKIKPLKSAALREMNFLCAFILSEKFCALFHKAFEPRYFENPDYKVLVSYIQSYFRKYSRPPKKLIVSYIEKHKNQFADDTLYLSLKKTLITSAESIDGLLEKYETQYIMDDAELFIKAAALRIAMDKINLALDGDNEEEALRTYEKMVIPEAQKSGIISFEDDLEKQREALRKNNNLVIRFDGLIGELIGNLYRGDFFTFVAPTGQGKTWWLMYAAKQARAHGLNVLFLSLEMQEQSVLRRFQQMYYRRTLHGEDVTISKFVQDDDNKYRVINKKLNIPQLKPEDVENLKLKKIGRYVHGRLKIVCRAGINIGDVRAVLSELKYQNKFIPEVIVLDYADKMTTTKRTNSERETLGVIWKDLRDLALEQNLLLITASQTNRASWDKHYDRTAIAEDARKLNEVSCAVGIMSDKRERELGLSMLRLLKIRDGHFESRDLYCSCNYHIGAPALDCVWARDLVLPDGESKEDRGGKFLRSVSGRRGLGRKK